MLVLEPKEYFFTIDSIIGLHYNSKTNHKDTNEFKSLEMNNMYKKTK